MCLPSLILRAPFGCTSARLWHSCAKGQSTPDNKSKEYTLGVDRPIFSRNHRERSDCAYLYSFLSLVFAGENLMFVLRMVSSGGCLLYSKYTIVIGIVKQNIELIPFFFGLFLADFTI